jgi:hypothetical protein
MKLTEVEKQLKDDIQDFLIKKLEDNVDITSLKYGNYAIFVHEFDGKPNQIHATIGIKSSILIDLFEEKVVYKHFLKFFKIKKKTTTYTKLGKLLEQNYVKYQEQLKIDIILENIDDEESFKKRVLKNSRKNKFKTII